MKTAVACLLALLLEVSNAFMIPVAVKALPAAADPCPYGSSKTSLAAGPTEQVEESEGGLDLDLEEMFTMFDAADKDEKFDDAIKKVKTDEKES
jgi:hypothetical protein